MLYGGFEKRLRPKTLLNPQRSGGNRTPRERFSD